MHQLLRSASKLNVGIESLPEKPLVYSGTPNSVQFFQYNPQLRRAWERFLRFSDTPPPTVGYKLSPSRQVAGTGA